MALEAMIDNNEDGHFGQTTASKSHMLDFIYDDKPLGLEKDPLNSTKRMQAQDPLEEVDLGDGEIKGLTYVSAKFELDMKLKLVKLLKSTKITLPGITMKFLT